MSELPLGWEEASLGSLLRFNYGRGLPERDRSGSGFGVYGSNGIVGRHKEALVQGETLVIGRKGSVGEVHYSAEPSWPIDTTYYVDDFRGMPSRFWYYALRSLRLDSLNRSTAIPGLSREEAYALNFAVPPLPEQKRIADKLDTLLARVDACRERLDRVPALLKRFRQSVLAAATSGELTREWREERGIKDQWPLVDLESVAHDFSYGTSAKSAKSGAVPVLRMGNIQEGQLDWDDLVFTSDDAEIRKYRLADGDVLFNRTNSPELVGKTAVFRGDREAIYAGYLIRVRCGERLLPDYLNYCLGSPAGREYCWQVKSDGVSQSNINAKKLSAFSFGLPSLEEQREIVRRVENLLRLNAAFESGLGLGRTLAGKLTTSVLAKAFRGELVPQDPNDEPASKLLARLRSAAASADQPSKAKRSPKRGKAASVVTTQP